MARIRSIKPEFWVSEQIAECSTNARLTFIGMWAFCDDNGVHPAKPKTLKAELYPMDDFSAADVASWVDELVRVGLIAEFTYEGVEFWHVTGWAKHQKIDRPSFKYPAPPDRNSESARGSLVDGSSNDRRAPPPGEEWRGEEGKGEDASSPKARAAPKSEASGTRLPSDWALTEELRAYCQQRRTDLDPDATADGFRDYWCAIPGAKGRKTDWAATWRRWVREQRQPMVMRASAGAVSDPFAGAA
ncbi:MAG: hypothetical protein KGN16_10390 [Burkholderiales bacterium]|nr:hypothetical protein [Burkholderiales bacterium]